MLVLQSGLPLPENDPVGQVLFFLTPLLGLALIFQSVLNFGRLLLDKGSRREAWQVSLAATLRDHVVVCGLGRISYRVVPQLLDSGYEAVVVERDWDTEFAATIRGLKVPIVSGDARDPVVLRQAGVLRARGLIAAINDDLLNVEIALAARRLRPDMLPVMRIFNQELDINLERAFGRNTAFSSSALAAPTLAAAALSQAIVQVLPLPDGLLGVAEITVAADSQIAGFVRGVEDRFGVRVLRYRDERGREQMPPRSIAPPFMRKLEGGDVVLLLGPLDALEAVRQHNQPGSKIWFLQAAYPTRTGLRMNTVIVCGLGKIGYRVVQVLHQSEPRPEIVVVCGEDTRPNFLDTVRSLGVRVVCGDAREPEVLVAAGIEQAYSVAAVVSNDLTNLQIGLTARRLRADIHVVLRVFSDVLAERLATLFGIHTTFSSSALAAPTLAAATIARDVD
jgi:Trk K+ transport system NAD-binding subunit